MSLIGEAKSKNDTSTVIQIIHSLTFISKVVYAKFARYHSVIFSKAIEMYEMKDSSVNLAVNEYFIKMLKTEKK